MQSRRRVQVALVLALGAPAWTSAQDTTRVQVGDRVRVRTSVADTRGRPIGCDARVSALAGDTLVLTNASRWAGCPARAYPADAVGLQVVRGDHGSRLAHAALGLLVGAAAGGALARLETLGASNDCTGSPCNDTRLTANVAMLAGAYAGALPAGPRWEAMPMGAPVRVAGLALRPSLHVGVGGR
jgi:hypothetical protein